MNAVQPQAQVQVQMQAQVQTAYAGQQPQHQPGAELRPGPLLPRNRSRTAKDAKTAKVPDSGLLRSDFWYLTSDLTLALACVSVTWW